MGLEPGLIHLFLWQQLLSVSTCTAAQAPFLPLFPPLFSEFLPFLTVLHSLSASCTALLIEALILMWALQKVYGGASIVAHLLKPLTVVLASHLNTGSNPSYSMSQLAQKCSWR